MKRVIFLIICGLLFLSCSKFTDQANKGIFREELMEDYESGKSEYRIERVSEPIGIKWESGSDSVFVEDEYIYISWEASFLDGSGVLQRVGVLKDDYVVYYVNNSKDNRYFEFPLSKEGIEDESKNEITVETTNEDPIFKSISSVIPAKAYLREYEKLVDIKRDIYIGLYVTDYKETTKPIIPPADYDSSDSTLGYFFNCLSQTNGQPLSGDYYAFVYNEGEITSLYKLPKPFDLGTDPLFLCLYNTPYNICNQYNIGNADLKCDEKSDKTLEKLDLIQLADYTGDGKKNEFQLVINTTGCGFRNHMIVGYNENLDKIMGYPVVVNDNKLYWYERFDPLGGFASIVYDCGDHGNETYSRNDFRFNKKTLQYENVFSVEKPCE